METPICNDWPPVVLFQTVQEFCTLHLTALYSHAKAKHRNNYAGLASYDQLRETAGTRLSDVFFWQSCSGKGNMTHLYFYDFCKSKPTFNVYLDIPVVQITGLDLDILKRIQSVLRCVSYPGSTQMFSEFSFQVRFVFVPHLTQNEPWRQRLSLSNIQRTFCECSRTFTTKLTNRLSKNSY